MDNYKQKFNIINHRGDVNSAVLQTGETVVRQDKLFVMDAIVGGQHYNGFIPCVPYDNHFIYETPINEHYKGYPAHMCTCGGMAVLIVPDAYDEDMSRHGIYLGCYFYHIAFTEDNGKFIHKHADGSS